MNLRHRYSAQHRGANLPIAAAIAVAAIVSFACRAHAAVTISSAATSNMTCSGGICAPTSTSAVLNANDLETLLGSGNVKVTTTGSGVQAKDILVKTKLTWSTSNALTLDAYDSITISQPVPVTGTGGLTLTTNDGGSGGLLSFGSKGNVTFANLSSKLTINGAGYKLANTVQGLAKDIAKNANGDFALAKSYDAKGDGTYATPPIQTTFGGSFEGLGNKISNLTIFDPTEGTSAVGLFAITNCSGCSEGVSIADLGLTNVNVEGPNGASIGGIVGYAGIGNLFVGDFVTGAVVSPGNQGVGGLVGSGGGDFDHCYSTATVTGGADEPVGGLVGAGDNISNSYATGAITGGDDSQVGGLEGFGLSISNSYATGNVTVGANTGGSLPGVGGGLIGYNYGDAGATVSNSYATGTVTGGTGSWVGGLVGMNESGPSNTGKITNSYASGAVTGGEAGWVGGLVGFNGGVISNSDATGNIAGFGQDGNVSYVGGLVGYSYGYGEGISNSYASGTVTDTGFAYVGGLVGLNQNQATITDSYASSTVAVTSGAASYVGGLVGYNGGGGGGGGGAISASFATGAVTATNSTSAYVGGLVGDEDTNGSIVNSYATTGAVTGGADDFVGGLVGGLFTGGSIATSYSTGAVTSGAGRDIGGLLGYDGNTSQEIVDAYWDTTTSGVTKKSQGAGNIANDPGIKGLTTTQLQSGLPSGFGSTIWKEKSKINDGLPYLIANPPPK